MDEGAIVSMLTETFTFKVPALDSLVLVVQLDRAQLVDPMGELAVSSKCALSLLVRLAHFCFVFGSLWSSEARPHHMTALQK